MDSANVLNAFLLTAFAGLSTGIGSTIALMARSTNKKLLTVSLGFSAGVMIYISFVEIFAEARLSFI
jgi:ZIP family zinc transporter